MSTNTFVYSIVSANLRKQIDNKIIKGNNSEEIYPFNTAYLIEDINSNGYSGKLILGKNVVMPKSKKSNLSGKKIKYLLGISIEDKSLSNDNYKIRKSLEAIASRKLSVSLESLLFEGTISEN
jgi:hypothetical protein